MENDEGAFALGGPTYFEFPRHSAEELELTKDDKKLSPAVLDEAILTMMHRYGQEGGLEPIGKTPFIEVSLGDDNEQTVEVCIGHGQTPASHIVFIKNPETGQVVDFLRFEYKYNAEQRTHEQAVIIADSHSPRLVETAEEFMFVRSLIDKMKATYEERVVAQANQLDISEHLNESIDAQIQDAEARLAALRALKDEANGVPKHNTYRVKIQTSWGYEGERNIDEVIVADSLSDAISDAVFKFKLLNRRSDVQSLSQYVGVVINKDAEIEIPNEVYAPLFKALSAHDSERSMLQRPAKAPKHN